MVVIHLPCAFSGVAVHALGDVNVSERKRHGGAGAEGSAIRSVAEVREGIIAGVPLWVERTEEEQMVFEARDVTADLAVQVIVRLVELLADQVEFLVGAAKLEIIGVQAFRFERLRSEVAADRTMEGPQISMFSMSSSNVTPSLLAIFSKA